MVVETILVVGAVTAGIAGIFSGIKRVFFKKETDFKIKLHSDGPKVDLDMAALDKYLDTLTNEQAQMLEQLSKAMERLEKLSEDRKPPSGHNSKEEGKILLDVLLLIVPGIIALGFAGTFIYLLIQNQDKPDYSTPKELQGAMTTIIGYYFGLGAATAMDKGQVVSAEDIAKALQNRAA